MVGNKGEFGEQWYMVIARVSGRDYLTRVLASSCGGAETKVLDLGYVGRRSHAIEAAQAFDIKGIKTDYFACNALNSEPICFEALKAVIEARNESIMEVERAEDRIAEIEDAMKMLEDELRQCKDLAGVE